MGTRTRMHHRPVARSYWFMVFRPYHDHGCICGECEQYGNCEECGKPLKAGPVSAAAVVRGRDRSHALARFDRLHPDADYAAWAAEEIGCGPATSGTVVQHAGVPIDQLLEGAERIDAAIDALNDAHAALHGDSEEDTD